MESLPSADEIAERSGVPKEDSETLRKYIQRLSRQFPDSSVNFEEVSDIYGKIAFAEDYDPSKEEWQTIESFLVAVEGDLSDFSHIVPHLRVHRENVEKYGLETLSLDAFVTVVAELADLSEDILRGDDKTIDSQIDAYL